MDYCIKLEAKNVQCATWRIKQKYDEKTHTRRVVYLLLDNTLRRVLLVSNLKNLHLSLSLNLGEKLELSKVMRRNFEYDGWRMQGVVWVTVVLELRLVTAIGFFVFLFFFISFTFYTFLLYFLFLLNPSFVILIFIASRYLYITLVFINSSIYTL